MESHEVLFFFFFFFIFSWFVVFDEAAEQLRSSLPI